ncbi:hypothetical protein Tco_0322710 [Tanacetum coccineum]
MRRFSLTQDETSVVADEVGNGNATTEDAKKNRKKKDKENEKKVAATTTSGGKPLAKKEKYDPNSQYKPSKATPGEPNSSLKPKREVDMNILKFCKLLDNVVVIQVLESNSNALGTFGEDSGSKKPKTL